MKNELKVYSYKYMTHTIESLKKLAKFLNKTSSDKVYVSSLIREAISDLIKKYQKIYGEFK